MRIRTVKGLRRRRISEVVGEWRETRENPFSTK